MVEKSGTKWIGNESSRLRIERLAPEIVAFLRSKSSAERLEMAYAMNAFARERLASHLRLMHGAWSEEQIAAEVARRLLWNSAT